MSKIMKINNLLKIILSTFLYYTGISQIILSILIRIKPAHLILMYHRINSDNNGIFEGVNIAIFKEQVKLLKKYFKITTLSKFISSNKNLKESYAVITFDDGYKSVYTRAFPILKEIGISATVFLTTGAIDKNDFIWTDKVNLIRNIPKSMRAEIKNRLKNLNNAAKDKELHILLSAYAIDINTIPSSEKMLTWDDIVIMAKEGLEFGAHTVNHPILTKVNKEEAEKEIVESKRRIESVIGDPVTTFCYPNGLKDDFNEHIKTTLKNNGFNSAVTAVEGALRASDDYLALRRIELGNRKPSVAILKIIKQVLKNGIEFSRSLAFYK